MKQRKNLIDWLIGKMNINNLVPPLELCKLIPDGEFGESAFVWIDHRDVYPEENANPSVVVRKIAWAATSKKGVYPAPTTDEILDKCKDIIGALNPTLWYQHEWIADCAFDRTGKLSAELFKDDDFKNLDIIEGRDNSPVIAAMQLWLKLKGIEYAEK